jgi:hypothetical protein
MPAFGGAAGVVERVLADIDPDHGDRRIGCLIDLLKRQL